MKKGVKKLLVGCACAGLIATGGLTLSGCSLSSDQQKALDVLTQNTETLVNDFGSYLDGQNSKIDKEKAADMIAKSRLNFIMSNFNNLEMNVNMNMYYGFEDEIASEGGFVMVYKSANGVKFEAEIENGEIDNLTKSDFNNDLHYSWVKDETNGDNFSEIEYYPYIWSMASADIFSQIPVGEIGEITPDDIYNIKSIEGGYEFELVTKNTDLTETDLTKYEEDDEIVIYDIIMKIEIKNDYITKVDFKGIQSTVPVNDLSNTNETIDVDKNGIPIIYNYAYVDIITMKMNVEYKYENIDYSAIENKIAEIEATYLAQE